MTVRSAIGNFPVSLFSAQKEVIRSLLSPNIDQHQISPCNVNAYSTREVKRIKDMITNVNFLDILLTSPQYFYKESKGTR